MNFLLMINLKDRNIQSKYSLKTIYVILHATEPGKRTPKFMIIFQDGQTATFNALEWEMRFSEN